MKDNPCKNCVPPKRNATCHSTCQDYIDWQEEYKAFLAKMKEKRRQRNIGYLGEHYKHPNKVKVEDKKNER